MIGYRLRHACIYVFGALNKYLKKDCKVLKGFQTGIFNIYFEHGEKCGFIYFSRKIIAWLHWSEMVLRLVYFKY